MLQGCKNKRAMKIEKISGNWWQPTVNSVPILSRLTERLEVGCRDATAIVGHGDVLEAALFELDH